MLSYSIIYNQIWFKDWVPVLVKHFIDSFRRFLPHAFNNFHQLFQKTSLAECNSNTVICSHIRIYSAVFLNVLRVRTNPPI